MSDDLQAFPFLFFGDGIAKFYENIELRIRFLNPITDEQQSEIDATIPLLYQDDVEWFEGGLLVKAEWARNAVAEMFPQIELTGQELVDAHYEAAAKETVTWLNALHQSVPVEVVHRSIDEKSGGTRFSDWHDWSVDQLESWLETESTDTNEEHIFSGRLLREIAQFETQKGKPIGPNVGRFVSIGSALAASIQNRDTDAILARAENFTSETLPYVANHTPGGINDSLFVIADQIVATELPERFWVSVNRAIAKHYGEQTERGERCRTMWEKLEGVTELHASAPFLWAIANDDDGVFQDALQSVVTMDIDCANIVSQEFKGEEKAKYVLPLLQKLEPDTRPHKFFVNGVRCVSSAWKYEGCDPEIEQAVEALRKWSTEIDKSQIDTLGGTAYQNLQQKNWASAVAIFYMIIANQSAHSSTHCNALYAIQVDNSGCPHRPDWQKIFLEDCLPLGPGNLDIYFNASAVFAELGDLDGMFDILQTLIHKGDVADYDLNKVEQDPFFVQFHDDPRWAELWG